MGSSGAEARHQVIVAVHAVTGVWIEPQPETSQRDRNGCFKGCVFYGCAAMQCREMSDAVRATCTTKEFVWRKA